MAINMMCMNDKCKYYWEDSCVRNLNEERIEINEDGKCETFEEGICDWYLTKGEVKSVMKATIITLAYTSYEDKDVFKELMKFASEVEKCIYDKEGMEVLIKTQYSMNARIHHHILINRSLASVESKWNNGPISIENITDKDHYRKAKEYLIT